MKSICFVVALFASMQVVLGAEEDFRPPTVAAVAVDAPPAIDGKLDDACWDEAIEVTGFHVFGKGAPAKYPTAMRLVTSGESLYLGVRCAKGKPPFKFVETARMRDGDVFRDDSIEVFLQPDPSVLKYYQFVVNPLGNRYDGTGRDRSWDGRWEAAAVKTKTGWSLELAIPFATLRAGPPKPNETWGFSIVRNELAGRESSCWADLTESFHEPGNFGRIVFSPPLGAEPRLAMVTGSGMGFLYIAPKNVRMEAYGVKKPSKLADAGRLNIVNPSFEMALHKWRADFPRRAYGRSPVSIDRETAALGDTSLCIDSTNPYAEITVTQRVIAPPTGRFEASCLLKLSDIRGRGAVILFADQGSHGYRQNLAVESTVVGDEPRPDGWIRRTVRFKVPLGCAFVRLGVEVKGYRGKVWVDGFSSCKVDRPERPMDGIWYWDATWDGDGMAARGRLYKMMDEKSPFLERAQPFNDTLVDAAFAVDDCKRLERALHYLGKPSRSDFAARIKAAYGELDCVNLAYAHAYVDGKPDDLARKVDAPLKKAAADVARLARDVRKELAALSAGSAKRIAPPPERPYKIASNGMPNQIIFGTWGKWQYRTLGRKLDVWKLTSNDGPASPKTRADGSLTWDHLLEYIQKCREAGVIYYGVRTRILAGLDTYVSPAFARAHGEREDFKTAGKWNLWRPEVLAEGQRALASLARRLKSEPAVLFHQFAWESSGPQWLEKTATDPARSSGLASFQKFLRQSYRTIGALNRA